MRIVVVEDEPRTRSGIIQLIHKIGRNYEVVGEAGNGAAGFELIERLKPDLVLMDIQMPNMTGIEMLEKLTERGVIQKTVILTGYSEFEYARKALRMGVHEYLEKPITAKDLKATLEKVEQELVYERLLGIRAGNANGKAEQMLERFVVDESESEELNMMAPQLQQMIGFRSGGMQVLSVYLGDSFIDAQEQYKLILSTYFESQEHVTYAQCDIPMHREIVAIFQVEQEPDRQDPLTCLMKLITEQGTEAVVCHAGIHDLLELKTCLTGLRKLRKWSIVLGNKRMISRQSTEILQLTPLLYPIVLEQKAKAAIMAAKWEEVPHYFNYFMDECAKTIHHPQDVFEAYVRFFTSVISVVAEISGDKISSEKQHELLLRLLQAQTDLELRSSFHAIRDCISDLNKLKSDSSNMTVNKALRMIHQQYQDGITLDEIAAALRITPEYLSSLFNKEVKKPFSSYIKEIRINKAKELLIVTDLKAYEVASKIGYSDSTYFSRVFKESTGMSPVEFQKLHR